MFPRLFSISTRADVDLAGRLMSYACIILGTQIDIRAACYVYRIALDLRQAYLLEMIRALRQVSSGKDETHSKPFSETLRVSKPAQESLTSTWKRVLRCGGATHPTKRRQPA